MKTAKEVLHTIPYTIEEPLKSLIIDAMERYAEEKLKNLTISDVSFSEAEVCVHNWIDWESSNFNDVHKCTKCGIIK